MLNLSAQLRQETGKNKQIRKQGLIPAILYGHRVKNLLLAVEANQFAKVYRQAGESSLIKLKIDGKERVVLIYQVARQPVTDQPIHIDFYQVKMDEPITTEVPLVFIGQSAAVKELNGVLVKNLQSLEIKALPADLPHEIEVDISCLKNFDDNVYIKDLKLPKGVESEVQPEEVVVSVIPPRTQAELEKLEEAPEESVEEVQVEGEEPAAAEEEDKKEEAQEDKSASGGKENE